MFAPSVVPILVHLAGNLDVTFLVHVVLVLTRARTPMRTRIEMSAEGRGCGVCGRVLWVPATHAGVCAVGADCLGCAPRYARPRHSLPTGNFLCARPLFHACGAFLFSGVRHGNTLLGSIDADLLLVFSPQRSFPLGETFFRLPHARLPGLGL